MHFQTNTSFLFFCQERKREKNKNVGLLLWLFFLFLSSLFFSLLLKKEKTILKRKAKKKDRQCLCFSKRLSENTGAIDKRENAFPNKYIFSFFLPREKKRETKNYPPKKKKKKERFADVAKLKFVYKKSA
jgi:hypothetical protein